MDVYMTYLKVLTMVFISSSFPYICDGAQTLVQRKCIYEALQARNRTMNAWARTNSLYNELRRAPIVDPTLNQHMEITPLDNTNFRWKRSAAVLYGKDVNFFSSAMKLRIQRRKKRSMFYVPEMPTTTHSTLQSTRDRSLCSWYTIVDVNITRYPRQMMKAVCHHDSGDNSCDYSFSRVFQDYPRIIRRLKLETECEIVYGDIEVINECCEGGVYSQPRSWIKWPVGCTCAQKNIRNVRPAGPLRN